MRTAKSMFLLVVALAILALPVHAGLNPADPGLPTARYEGVPIGNNGFSAMCVDCHTRNPAGPGNGSHYVARNPNVAGADRTRTGGGWGVAGVDSWSGVRMDGSYLKIGRWPADNFSPGPPYIGGFSKYGDVPTKRSVSFGSDSNHTGVVDNTLANYATRELICESCHNLLTNVEGGNNLLARARPNDKNVLGAANTAFPICNGCHGFMMARHAANGAVGGLQAAKYNHPINQNEISGVPRGNNQMHWVNGVGHQQNHHVTEYDAATKPLALAGLLNRDVPIMDVEMPDIPMSMRPMTQMPAKPSTQYYDFKRPDILTCEGCHASGHFGNAKMGTSILRDTSDLTPNLLIDPEGVTWRFGEGTPQKIWASYQDVAFCMDCHLLKP